MIEQLGKNVGLLESEKDQALQKLINEADFSRYGALNNITAISTISETSDERALELEEIGGGLLNMSQSEWNRIANSVKVAVAAEKTQARPGTYTAFFLTIRTLKNENRN